MPPKRKRAIDFVDGFERPSESEVKLAYSVFPSGLNNLNIEKELLGVSNGSNSVTVESIGQLYNDALFENKRNVWKELPSPIDDDSWLAKYHENGQSVNDYIKLVTDSNGNFDKKSNACKHSIYIVPIVEHSSNVCWPSNAPDVTELANLVSAWFNRNVVILDFVSIESCIIPRMKSNKNGNDKIDSTESKMNLVWHSSNEKFDIPGRICHESGRYQVGVDGLLCKLGEIQKSGLHNGKNMVDNFATIGITMIDLYSHDSDLFIAGYACADTKASVLSFARYHPRLKMSPFYWHDYGYMQRNTTNSYYIDHKPIPKTSKEIPHPSAKSSLVLKIELFRRAAKLLVHEIGHLYGLEHCIYHHCNMNGTAHLIEDFAAPSYFCGICLKKLQFRLGFDVKKRYVAISVVYDRVGLIDESKWVRQRLIDISM